MSPTAKPLVGRSAELTALEAALAAARREFAAVEVVGEPGIGKTRLLAALEARADAQGCLVLAGSASELEADLPFGLFVDALDEYLYGLEPRRLAGLDEDDRAELAHVFPALAGGAETLQERYRLHRAVRALLEELAAPQPLVLVLDDLHWADSGSLELLGSLLRRPPAAPVLLALAVRPRQVPERLAAALERIDADRARRAEPGARRASSSATPPTRCSPTAAATRSTSSNSPARRAGPWPGRRSRSRASRSRARSPPRWPASSRSCPATPARCSRAPRSPAIRSSPSWPPRRRASSDGVALDALDELLRGDLVRPTDVPRRFRFRHPLVRGAVYEGAPGGWRLLAHERSAAALAARGASALERAHHVERSARHGDPAAIAVLREAGEAAAGRAPATAARLLAPPLRLLGPRADGRADLLAAQASAHMGAGQWREAYDAIRESLALSEYPRSR